MVPLAALGLLLALQTKPLQERMTMSSGTVVRIGRRTTVALATPKRVVAAHSTVAPLSGADLLRILGGSMAGVHVVGGPARFTASALAVPGVGAMKAVGFFVDADLGGDGFMSCDLAPGSGSELSFDAKNYLKDSRFLVVVNLQVFGSVKVTFRDGLSPDQVTSVVPGEDHVAFFMRSNPSGQFTGTVVFGASTESTLVVSSVQVQPYK